MGCSLGAARVSALEDAAPAELRLKEDARELEVVVERLRRLVGTVRDARREKLLVERAVGVLWIACGREQRGAEALRANPRRPDQRHEPRRIGRVVEGE